MEDKRAALSVLVNEFIGSGDNSLKPRIEGLILELRKDTGDTSPVEPSFFETLRGRFKL